MNLAGQLIGLEVSRMDLATRLVSMPPHARVTRGLPPDGPDFPIDSVLDRMVEPTRRAFERTIAAAATARPEAPDLPLPRPRAFRRPDGEVRWIDSIARVLFDDAGRPEAILSAAIDVTERVQEREQLRALTARVQRVREEEKARIARDLHDDLGQVLTALRLELRGAETLLEALDADERTGPIADRLVTASTLAADTIGAVQRLSWNLRSEALERLGLDAALRQELRRFEKRTGLEVVEALRPVEPLDHAVATAAFRIAQEALTNVARHAGARRVEVSLLADGDRMRLEVADDGCGLPPGGPRPGDLGLLGMRERAREFGGDVTISDRAGGGTVVVARMPRNPGARP
jgi:signal transduction histidine kinase